MPITASPMMRPIGVRQSDAESKNCCEHGIDDRNNDLRAHDCVETVVEIVESSSSFAGTESVKIIIWRFPSAAKLAPKKQTGSNNDSDDDEQHQRAGGARKLGDDSQIT